MDWTLSLLVLIVLMLFLIILLTYFNLSGLANLIKRQDALKDSMQTLSEQLTDIETQNEEIKEDVRKLFQYFVNFAKASKGSDKPWYSGL